MSKLFSLVVAALYVLIAYFGDKAVEGFAGVIGVALILGLACIWFGDEIGGIARGTFDFFPVTSTTPGSFVRFIGWVLLLALPLFAFMLQEYVVKSW